MPAMLHHSSSITRPPLRRNTPSAPVLSSTPSKSYIQGGGIRNIDYARLATTSSRFSSNQPHGYNYVHPAAVAGNSTSPILTNLRPLDLRKTLKQTPSLPFLQPSEVGSSVVSIGATTQREWEMLEKPVDPTRPVEIERRRTVSGAQGVEQREMTKAWVTAAVAAEGEIVEPRIIPAKVTETVSAEEKPEKKKHVLKRLSMSNMIGSQKRRARTLSTSVIPAVIGDSSKTVPRRTSSGSTVGRKIMDTLSFGKTPTPEGEKKDKGLKRMFGKKEKDKKLEIKVLLPPPPVLLKKAESFRSDQTVITRRSYGSRSVESEDDVEVGMQMDGHGEGIIEDMERALNDSVVGIFNGRSGGRTRSQRYQPLWKPPVLELDLKIVSDLERIPVESKRGPQEAWVSVSIDGNIRGDVDFAKAPMLGLDVGVLMDLSTFISPDAFEEMKHQAKRLVEAMDTAVDRVAVMTFTASPWPVGKRPGFRGRSLIRQLNSSGSVAKKTLINNIDSLQTGVRLDPTNRDVSGAIMAAIQELHQMPLETSKYGTRRAGHLFLITSHLNPGEIKGDFGGVRVHVIGVGTLFSPSAEIGCDGWCVSSSAELHFDSVEKERLDMITEDEVSGLGSSGLDIHNLLNTLRLGIDVGSITDGEILLSPGKSCKIRGVVGSTTFPLLLPGERKNLLIKLEVGEIQDWPKNLDGISDSFTFDQLNRELEATLGELKSTILTVSLRYRHSLLPPSTITTASDVDVSRFIEESIWSSSGTAAPINPVDYTYHCHQTFMETHLLPTIASLPIPISSSAIRTILDHCLDTDPSPIILRELQHKAWLEDTFPHIRPAQNMDFLSPFNADRHCTSSGTDAYEALFFPNTSTASPSSSPSSTAPSSYRNSSGRSSSYRNSLSLSQTVTAFTTPRTSLNIDVLYPDRRQSLLSAALGPGRKLRTPDEARKLWMKLQGLEGEEDVEEELLREFVRGEAFRDAERRATVRGRHRGSGREGGFGDMEGRRTGDTGKETVDTLRNVRETDFPPWAP